MDFGRNTSYGPKDPEENAELATLTTETQTAQIQTVLLSIRREKHHQTELSSLLTFSL